MGWTLILDNAHPRLMANILNRDDDSAVTLVSRRILPSLEEIQSSQNTVALLADSSLSEAREGQTDSRSRSSTTINFVP